MTILRSRFPAILCVASVLTVAALALPGTLLCNTDRPLRPAAGVRDPVFAVLLGFVLDNHEGDLDSTRVRAEVERIGRKPKLPYRWIKVITRGPAGDAAPSAFQGGGTNGDAMNGRGTNGHGPIQYGEFEVSSLFDRVIDVPVPYQILGYHPGSFRGSSRLDFREIDLGSRNVPYAVERKDGVSRSVINLEDVRLYVLKSGLLEIDIDGWLDRMAGSKLDDTRVAGLVVFRKDGALYGMALGYNPDGEPRSGTISFGEDKILYPNPPELKAVARQIRREIEALAPDLPARYKGWK